MFVRPLAGLLIRDPRTRVPLPVAGANVPEDSFWLRRERDGSIERAEPPADPAPAETAPHQG